MAIRLGGLRSRAHDWFWKVLIHANAAVLLYLVMALLDTLCGHHPAVLAGLAFLFSVGFLLQILGCVLYNNWWPMLTGLMYIMLPMPCLFFGGDSSGFINSEGGDWGDAAKFLTGFSSVGSIAIPAILRHANLITAGAMWIEFTAFFVLLATVAIFQHVTQEDDYY